MLVFGGVTTVRMCHICECTGWKNSRTQSQINLFCFTTPCLGFKEWQLLSMLQSCQSPGRNGSRNLKLFRKLISYPISSMYGTYIYQHLVYFYGKCRKIYHTCMLWVCVPSQVSAKGCWALYCGARVAEGCWLFKLPDCLCGVFDQNPGIVKSEHPKFSAQAAPRKTMNHTLILPGLLKDFHKAERSVPNTSVPL